MTEIEEAAAQASRRQVLRWAASGVGAFLVAGVAGFELVDHGVLPGKQDLDELDGACSVPAPVMSFSTPGPSLSGTFFSKARKRSVGYTLAYPPGHHVGDPLSLTVMLHGYGNNHRNALVGMSPAQALALKFKGASVAPMALVTVDGGNGY